MKDAEVVNWFAYDNLWKQEVLVNLDFGEAITETQTITNFELTGKLADIENRLGQVDLLTCDETGFTVDSTKITCDRTMA